jgi:hypothetical protein
MSDSRDSPLALKPDFDVLDAHGIWSGQSHHTVQLDSLSFMLVSVEDDEAIVGTVGDKSALQRLQSEAGRKYMISSTGLARGVCTMATARW